MDIDKYDEYYTNRPQREVITVETKIKSTNKGFSMLARMGWVEGTPLEISGEGAFLSNLRDQCSRLSQVALNLSHSA